ncbi:hypothetical protein ACFFOU_29270 [Pseudonocardia sulfidoxydans]|uniref:hypothetical protein n=1 Tax=Pseudonocardia sulfidoxydans TaxID=54011 RepID=UPI00164A03C6|nr:hypothetical protein [Pseudonocardia sulfidoxydans]
MINNSTAARSGFVISNSAGSTVTFFRSDRKVCVVRHIWGSDIAWPIISVGALF